MSSDDNAELSRRVLELTQELSSVKRVANDLAIDNQRLKDELEACSDVASDYQQLFNQVGEMLSVPAEPHQGRDLIILERVRELAAAANPRPRSIITKAGMEMLDRAAQEFYEKPNDTN